MAPSNFWTSAREALLRGMWTAGRTSSQIARELGCSKNVVIGKKTRLGLEDRRTNIIKRRLQRERHANGAVQAVVLQRLMHKPAVQLSPAAPKNDQDIPQTQRKTLLELNDTVCHWPVGIPGEPEFFFCGRRKQRHTSSYCDYHYAKSHEKPRKI